MNFKDFFKEKEIKKIFKKSQKEDELYRNFEDRKLNLNEHRKLNINLEKIKDIGLIAIAVILIGVGYVRFSDNKTKNQNSLETAKTTNNIGDVELVNSDAVLVDNPEEEISNSASETVEVVESENYFETLRMERNNMYSKSIETYQKIVENTTISNEQKAIAIQEIEKIDNKQNSILIAEELIKLKGFEDAVIYENSDSVTVIVRISALSTAQVAQIQNIVSTQMNVNVDKITISNK